MPLRVRDGRCRCVGLHGEASECDVAVAIRMLAAPYALDLFDLLSAHGAPVRFSELQEELDLAPNTLARRLQELVGSGAVVREATGYALSATGARLWGAAQALGNWRA